MSMLTALDSVLAGYPSLLVGYSGGVDSALVSVAARRVLGRERSLAVIALSPSLAAYQREQAARIAAQFDLNLLEVSTDELDDPNYAANGTNRCYFCKRTLWDRLAQVASERGVAVVADGSNLDDLHDHRPGRRATREAAVHSPLVEAGYTKTDVRNHARALGIPIWDAPASPCLSSRVMYGLSVTRDRLRQVEDGEALLRSIGVRGDLRVRHRGGEARIEVDPGELAAIRTHRAKIAAGLLDLGFSRVTLDLNGYRRGSLLSDGEADLELLAERA
jgi:uncharacterized protein